VRELPGGTVTFLFTDIAGSTKLRTSTARAMRTGSRSTGGSSETPSRRTTASRSTPRATPSSWRSSAPRTHWRVAVQLLGSSERLLKEVGAPRWDPVDYEQVVAKLRDEMGDPDFEAAWAAGAELSEDDALSLAARCLDSFQ